MTAFLIRERTVLFVIVINSLALFFDAFNTIPDALSVLLFWVDYICIIYFILEAVLKMNTFGIAGYFRDGWNVFDFIIVAACLPALGVPFGLGFQGLAALLVLRLARVLRFLRLLHFIPNIERIIEGSKRALRASIGILLFSLFLIFLFGMAATYLFGDSTVAGDAFSDPLMSMYTIFKIFTVEGWYEMPDTLAGGSQVATAHLIRVFFISAVVVGGIIILSLLNAVFVDEMSSDIAEHTEDEMLAIKDELAALRKEMSERLDSIAAKL